MEEKPETMNTESAERPGTDPGEKPGTDPGERPGTDPGERPGTDPGERPGAEPGESLEGEPESGERPGAEPGERPGGESGDTAKIQEGNEEPERESGGFKCRGAAEPVCPGKRSDAEVSVMFSGPVSQDGCCRLVCEIIKHVLYQRQQLPLPYEQLSFFTRRAKEAVDGAVMSRPRKNEQTERKKYQRTLSDLDDIFQNLEAVFGLTKVPRVHILLGGSVIHPKELYEVNMERVALGNREKSLETLSCIRKLFHTLFVQDVLNDLRSVPLMNMLLLVQGNRDSGIQWFRPKLNYRVPERSKKLLISLSCSSGNFSPADEQTEPSDRGDYIWFQAPIIIKGFHA